MAVIELVDRNTEAKKVDKPKKLRIKKKNPEVEKQQVNNIFTCQTSL